MNTGPFTMMPSDQEVVFAIMHVAAAEAKASVDYLKEVDLLAQLAYDIQFALPASPPSPEVSVTAYKDQILLSWDNSAESYNQVDVIDKLPVPVSLIQHLRQAGLRTILLSGATVLGSMDNIVEGDTTTVYNVQYMTTSTLPMLVKTLILSLKVIMFTNTKRCLEQVLQKELLLLI